jgi:hypothetical protein
MANQPTVAELQALILQLQTQVQALENAATAASIVQAAPTAPQAVIFADTPQTLGTKDLINYSLKRGSDIYKQGIAPLDDKALTDGFNMTAGQTLVFTEAFLNCATAMGWNKGSKQITTFNNSSGVTVDIIKDEAWRKEPPKVGESKEGKKVGKFNFNWCEHHMAWTVHKPTDCHLGKQHKDEQKKPYKANSATITAAATLAVNPHFAALMAAMANLDMNE